MIFRFKKAMLVMGEINLAQSMVMVNKLNNKLQRISADKTKIEEINALAAQILFECEIIRKITNEALQGTKPGLFEKWFGNGNA
jgi:hypothetical protein